MLENSFTTRVPDNYCLRRGITETSGVIYRLPGLIINQTRHLSSAAARRQLRYFIRKSKKYAMQMRKRTLIFSRSLMVFLATAKPEFKTTCKTVR